MEVSRVRLTTQSTHLSLNGVRISTDAREPGESHAVGNQVGSITVACVHNVGGETTDVDQVGGGDLPKRQTTVRDDFNLATTTVNDCTIRHRDHAARAGHACLIRKHADQTGGSGVAASHVASHAKQHVCVRSNRDCRAGTSRLDKTIQLNVRTCKSTGSRTDCDIACCQNLSRRAIGIDLNALRSTGIGKQVRTRQYHGINRIHLTAGRHLNSTDSVIIVVSSSDNVRTGASRLNRRVDNDVPRDRQGKAATSRQIGIHHKVIVTVVVTVESHVELAGVQRCVDDERTGKAQRTT